MHRNKRNPESKVTPIDKSIEYPVSAGGVVYRKLEQHTIEVVLCGREKPLLWGLPKGTPEEGETLQQTALREVLEETGLVVNIHKKVKTINYQFVRPTGAQCFKKVHFYLMSAIGGSTTEHDQEFDEVAWVSSDKALSIMQYDNERLVLKTALKILQ
jgi:8-oxo-dGTP pyrophosphatase MutT (NUDIX family)